MIHRLITATGLAGIVLALAFSGTTTNRFLITMADSFEPTGSQDLNVSFAFILGEIGLLLFSLAIVSASTVERLPTLIDFSSLLGASLALALSSLLIGYDTLITWTTFRALASAELVDPESFTSPLKQSRIFLVCGWLCALLSSAMLLLRAFAAQTTKLSRLTVGFWLGIGCSTVLALSASYGCVSLFNLSAELSTFDAYDPTTIASSVVGLLLARFLTVLGLAIGSASILVSAANSPRTTLEEPPT